MGLPATVESELVKQLAEKHRKTVQWARQQRRENTPLWREILQDNALAAADIDGAPVADLQTMPLTEQAALNTRTAWQQLRRLESALARCGGNQAAVAVFSRAIRDARKSWQEATLYESRVKKEAGQMVPVEDIRLAFSEVVTPLGSVFAAFENKLLQRLPEEYRAAVATAWREELPEWNRAMIALNDRAKELLRC